MKRVLVVDDDVAVQRHCREILEAEGFEVVTEASLGSTRRALRTRPAEAVLLDLFLPDGCGFELFKTSADLLENVPVVGMTAVYQGSANARLLTSRYPFTAIVAKPVSPSALVGALRGALGERYPKTPDWAAGDGGHLSAAAERELDLEPPPTSRREERRGDGLRGLTREPPTHNSTFISPLDVLKGTRTSDSTLSAWDPTREEGSENKAGGPGRASLRGRTAPIDRPTRRDPPAEPPPAAAPSAPSLPSVPPPPSPAISSPAAPSVAPAPQAAPPAQRPPLESAPALASVPAAPISGGLDAWDIPATPDPPDPPEDVARRTPPANSREAWGAGVRRSIHRPAANGRGREAEPEPPAAPWRGRGVERGRGVDRGRSGELAERESGGSLRRAVVVDRPTADPTKTPEPQAIAAHAHTSGPAEDDHHTFVVDVRSSDGVAELDSGGYEVLEEELQLVEEAWEPAAPAAAERRGSDDLHALHTPDHLDVRYIGHQGRLDATPFPLVLCRLAHEQATGSLMLRRDQIKKIVFFEAGVPVAVKSNLLYECLGRLLVRDGIISEEVCERSVERLKSEGRPQGKILVEMGMLTETDLQQALEIQFDTKLLDVFTWDAGLFQFRPSPFVDPGYSSIRRDPWATILYGVRMGSPVERISVDLATVTSAVPWVTVSSEALAGLALMDTEWDILGLLDGQRTLADLVALTHGSEVTWRLFYGLTCVGAVGFQLR